MKNQISRPLLLASGLLAVTSTIAQAKEVAPFVGLTVDSHSNVRRVQSPEEKDVLIRPYAGIEYADETSDYEAKVNLEGSYETYQDGSFDNKFLLKADSYIDWIVQPGRFIWSVEDYAGQYRINITDPDVPDNVQNVNVLATGPDFLFARGSGEVVLKGRYANVAYSETNDDSNRLIGAVSLARSLNAYSSFNLDSTLSIVKYVEAFYNDYNVITTGGRYTRELPYGKFYGALGYNGFDFESGESKNDPYYDANLFVDLGAGSELNFTSAFKLTDLALEAFNPLYTRLQEDLGIDKLTAETSERGAAGVYRVTRSFGSYTYRGSLFSLSVYGYFNRQNYFDFDDNNFTENGAGVSTAYELNDRTVLRAGYNGSATKYRNAPVDADVLNSPIGFDVDRAVYDISGSYNFAENMYVVLGVASEDSQSANVDRDFKDSRIYATVEYRAAPKLLK